MNANESASSRPIDPDQSLTVAEFARWLGVGEGWVRDAFAYFPVSSSKAGKKSASTSALTSMDA